MKLGAVVPAAGLSRRMGREKILLPFGSSTMLETVLARLAQANISRTVVVLRPDLPAAEAAARAGGADVVVNPHPEDEMLVSIRLGIERIAGTVDAVFVWPADHPAVSADTLQRLAAAASREIAVLPIYEGRRGHPALVGAELLAGVAEIPPNEGLRWLWRDRADAVRELAVDDPGVVENLDDPDTYEKARRRDTNSRSE
ncbi:MAG TPA: nucleotidyltransferase family protein [Thermoanaerobaculia bacterium]|jgi:molybdenum cofactor cytidylyltransferase